MFACGTERGRFQTRLRTPAPEEAGRGGGRLQPCLGLAGVALPAQTPLPGGTGAGGRAEQSPGGQLS